MIKNYILYKIHLIFMEAKEAINKIKSLLGMKLAEEETPEEVNEVVEETPEEPIQDTSIEDKVNELETRINDLTQKIDDLVGIVTEIVDRQSKSDDEVKEEVKEEVVEELSKTVPTAKPVHISQSRVASNISSNAAKLMELRKK